MIPKLPDRQTSRITTSISVRFPLDIHNFLRTQDKKLFVMQSIDRFLQLMQNPEPVLVELYNSYPKQFKFVQDYYSSKQRKRRARKQPGDQETPEAQPSVKFSFEIPIKTLKEIEHFSLTENNSKFIINAVRLNMNKQKELVKYLMSLRFMYKEAWLKVYREQRSRKVLNSQSS